MTVCREGGIRQQLRDGVEAADTGHFFGDVGFDDQVASPGRHGRDERLDIGGVDLERARRRSDQDGRAGRGRLGLDADACQHAGLFRGRQVGAEQPVDAGGPERDTRRLWLCRVRVDGAGRDLATGPLVDEPGGAIGTQPCQTMFLALLEPEAGLGSQREPEGGPADADRVEDGRLDHHVRRRLGDLGPRAAHHARDAQRSDGIGDEQGVGRELAHVVVERLHALALASQPHDDRPVVDRGSIERMDRLAELEHHVVAHVDHVADRPLPGGDQPHLDEVGRWLHGHAADPASDEPRCRARAPRPRRAGAPRSASRSRPARSAGSGRARR